ncbi:MAG TPA: sigma-70 family RNA polymerase sigma factor [Planctomycetes bacterium]|nr:sigma-70 family RNA polymerase sigma factor [Planctomycetota bacterium]HIN79832.1 sigma-70 family RNA polymerase sigma factor [Planctomycetota bacterium]
MRGFPEAAERSFWKLDTLSPICLNGKEMRENPEDTVELLRRWRGGDAKALDTLLADIMPWLEKQVRRRLGNQLRAREETQDFVQQALIDFLDYAPRTVIEDGRHLRALLVRIVENTIRGRHDHYSAQRRAMQREVVWPGESHISPAGGEESRDRPSFAAHQGEQSAFVSIALELLDDASHDIVTRRLWAGESFEQIGTTLGTSADAARMRFHRALARLSGFVEGVRQGKIGDLLKLEDDEREESTADDD